MTDTREALIKELRDCIERECSRDGGAASWTIDAITKAADMLEMLSAPVDAEREELAKWHEQRADEIEARQLSRDDAMLASFTVEKYRKTAQLLRRPVEPVVTIGEPVRLDKCPPGPFLFDGSLAFLTEYKIGDPDDPSKYWPEAYVAASGEAFWGGTSIQESRAALMVRPVQFDEAALNVSQPGVK